MIPETNLSCNERSTVHWSKIHLFLWAIEAWNTTLLPNHAIRGNMNMRKRGYPEINKCDKFHVHFCGNIIASFKTAICKYISNYLNPSSLIKGEMQIYAWGYPSCKYDGLNRELILERNVWWNTRTSANCWYHSSKVLKNSFFDIESLLEQLRCRFTSKVHFKGLYFQRNKLRWVPTANYSNSWNWSGRSY